MGKYNLVYFPVRGRGEAIRTLLTDQGQDWEETNVMPWETFVSVWKPKMAFGQVPALYDGDFLLVQSCAILRYLARKIGLYGSDEKEAALIDQLNDGVEDLRNAYVKLIYQNYDEGKPDYIKKLPDNLRPFENLLKDSKADETGAAVGGKISFVDYNLFDLLDNHQVLSSGCLADFPVLKAYYAKMAARPNISAYRQTEAFKTRKINGNDNQ